MRKNGFWKEHKKQIITGGITLILLTAGLFIKDYFSHKKEPPQNNTTIQKNNNINSNNNNKDSSQNIINTVNGDQYNAKRDIIINKDEKKIPRNEICYTCS